MNKCLVVAGPVLGTGDVVLSQHREHPCARVPCRTLGETNINCKLSPVTVSLEIEMRNSEGKKQLQMR